MAVEIVNFRAYHKNTLRGFTTLLMPTLGLEIRDVTIHEKNGSKWLGLPAKPFEKQDGTTSWIPIVRFTKREIWERFQREALLALNKHIENSNSDPKQDQENGIPF
jgi:hypothetical protein